MLIEFSVGNYRSFKDVVTLSMVAADEAADNDELDKNNVFKVNQNFSLLKSAAIYGANASGKSNLILALYFRLFGLCYAMNGGYKGWNPYIERHLAIFVNYFRSRAN